MSTKVALEHRTSFRFDRPIGIGPHVIRLRPAPHTRTPIEAYSLSIQPAEHFINWQQDPFGNYLARVVFPAKADHLEITVGLVADLGVINPFDFFIEDYAQTVPFDYAPDLVRDLAAYRAVPELAPDSRLAAWLAGLEEELADPQPAVTFLGALNAAVHRDVAYSVRMEEGVLAPEETLTRGIGSCRDSAWLLVSAFRHFGLAARFVSGYLVQLAPDQVAGDPPAGPEADFTDLHAWAEVYLPGAGWIGLDPTSALFAGEGHLPLAATPEPSSAAAISGATEPAETVFEFANTVRRVHEDPRPTQPYTATEQDRQHALGLVVDERLVAAGLELTMGGEPTFVSMDDGTAPQWTIAADGPQKRALANDLAAALGSEFAAGGIVQRGQGKWYPGEDRPRWQIALIWRTDGETLWSEPDRIADPTDPGQAHDRAGEQAATLASALTAGLELPATQRYPAYEDPLSALADAVRQPSGPRPETDPTSPSTALVTELDAAETEAAAWVLPLVPDWFGSGWASPAWRTRRSRLVLVPGDLPAGTRLPLDSLSWRDPDFTGEAAYGTAGPAIPAPDRSGTTDSEPDPPQAVVVDPDEVTARTALVVEARDGFVYVFLPPVEQLEKFVELIRLVERSAAATGVRVVLEGYGPPPDPRLTTLLVTPDPGVIEVNLQPSSSWTDLAHLTRTLFRLARERRLGAETFALDGRHSGTGGGNHWTLGGPEPSRSPLLRRPDLLVSLLTCWQHHPGLSYLFAGRFVGPTSQAPRVDEGLPENLYELEIAFAEIEALGAANGSGLDARPWAVDRALRHLLTDITGNTHRSEFCVDKLYSPDSSRGRLGLLELRGFEMPPHADLALVQALLIRTLVARFAERPRSAPLVRWGGRLHEEFLLPHFVWADLAEVVADLNRHGFDFDLTWLQPFLDFRFPRIGSTEAGGVTLELRTAIEPWHVLGEEASSGGTARYVDSSTERLQVRVDGFAPERQLVTVNGRPLPLVPAGSPGAYVAGVRYKAWKPWSALHPTAEIDAPLHVDVVDRASELALGGATYHVVHPGGRAYHQPPVNASEAEARRASRFEAQGHDPGRIDVAALDRELGVRRAGADLALTLDLRRRVPRRWSESESSARANRP